MRSSMSAVRQRTVLVVAVFGSVVVSDVSAGQRDLLVGSFFSDNVTRYDRRTGAFISEFVPAGSGGLSETWGVTFGPDGNLYVASSGTREILQYDGTTGEFLGVFASRGGTFIPIGTVFGDDGNLYVSTVSSSFVLRFDGKTGQFMDVFTSGRGIINSRGLTFGPGGDLYVCDISAENILRYDGETGVFIDEFVAVRSGGLTLPRGLAFGRDGSLYVASSSPGRILRFDGTTGEFLGARKPAGSWAFGLVFGLDGSLYASFGNGFGDVLRYDGTTGELKDGFTSGGLGNRSMFLTFMNPVDGLLGDSDADWDVDRQDHVEFRSCVTGDRTVPGFVPPPDECDVMDFDGDGDVDLLDFGGVMEAFTGDCGVRITQQPDDVSTCLGDATVLEVRAEGSDISYQWALNGNDIPGATDPLLVIDPILPESAGLYRASVSGGCSVVASAVAKLVASDDPTIVISPHDVAACLGGTAEFSIGVDGLEPIGYQWQHDGQDIPGATETVYTIESVQSQDPGAYRCIITDGCGTESASAAATLAVPEVSFVTQPAGDRVCVGDSMFLLAIASGSPSYQWFRDGEPIPGATGMLVRITDVTTEDSGIYHVVATGLCETVRSNDAMYTVDVCGDEP